ncbi:tripartite motif-containing protein [Pimephales promelas]|nr:tripartite motif-containing protein [Pimephales promelas]
MNSLSLGRRDVDSLSLGRRDHWTRDHWTRDHQTRDHQDIRETFKMAEAKFFMCPVCLDLLKDPVTTSCGHSYCKICIKGCWDQEDEKRVYSCPQCRQTFSSRPALAKNTILAEVVEKLKKTTLPAECYAGAGDVQCDVCTGRKHKAVKSCLECLNSYCQSHLEQHESWFKGKRHNLTEATGRLQEMICQTHDKLLEVFCRTDQKCICLLCVMDEHKNHDTVSAAAQRTEKQHQLKETQRSIQQRIQQREKDLQQLREAVESHKRSAQTAVEDSERIFTEFIRSIERSRSEATQRIRDQEKTAVSRAEGRLERLEQEINDLRRRHAELEQLSHTQDHIQFLQSFQSLSALSKSTDVNDNPCSTLSSFDGVRESVRQMRFKLEDFCKEELKKISDRVTFTNIVPRTRNDFLQYSLPLTLDLNTVNKRLCLTENNRVITHTLTVQPYPDHPDRFDVWQVQQKSRYQKEEAVVEKESFRGGHKNVQRAVRKSHFDPHSISEGGGNAHLKVVCQPPIKEKKKKKKKKEDKHTEKLRLRST